MNNCKLVVFAAAIAAASVSCQSAKTKPCVGYKAGPRLTSFGVATLPHDHGPLFGMTTGAIIGSVSDSETGNGVPHATVTLRLDSTSKALAYATPDSIGGFTFANLPAAKYFLSARGLTYPQRSVHTEVRAGAIDTVRIELRFNPLYVSCEGIVTS